MSDTRRLLYTKQRVFNLATRERKINWCWDGIFWWAFLGSFNNDIVFCTLLFQFHESDGTSYRMTNDQLEGKAAKLLSMQNDKSNSCNTWMRIPIESFRNLASHSSVMFIYQLQATRCSSLILCDSDDPLSRRIKHFDRRIFENHFGLHATKSCQSCRMRRLLIDDHPRHTIAYLDCHWQNRGRDLRWSNAKISSISGQRAAHVRPQWLSIFFQVSRSFIDWKWKRSNRIFLIVFSLHVQSTLGMAITDLCHSFVLIN